MRRPSDRIVAAALFTAFFALYALTAQRGLGWGDSGEFQHWILDGKNISASEGFSNLHPLYLAVAGAFASSPFSVTLVSSLFGALAVTGMFFCVRNALLAALFGLSHMVWWLSCVAEVQTMSLAFTVFGTLAFLRWLETRRGAWFAVAAFLAGLQLECHNFALLLLPVYAAAAFLRRLGWRYALLSSAVFAVGASYWLYAIVERGMADVLVGSYGQKVAGFLPGDWRIAAVNLAIASVSFVVPLLIVLTGGVRKKRFDVWIVALLAVNSLFFIRYFVPDQATFLMPTLFFAYVVLRDADIGWRRASIFVVLQLVLPVVLFAAMSAFPRDSERDMRHPHRDDAAYFALPWKHNDDSADKCASEQSGPWDGYWHPERANGVIVK